MSFSVPFCRGAYPPGPPTDHTGLRSHVPPMAFSYATHHYAFFLSPTTTITTIFFFFTGAFHYLRQDFCSRFDLPLLRATHMHSIHTPAHLPPPYFLPSYYFVTTWDSFLHLLVLPYCSFILGGFLVPALSFFLPLFLLPACTCPCPTYCLPTYCYLLLPFSFEALCLPTTFFLPLFCYPLPPPTILTTTTLLFGTLFTTCITTFHGPIPVFTTIPWFVWDILFMHF